MNENDRIIAPGYIKLRGKEDCELNEMIVETNWTGPDPSDPGRPRVAIHLFDANLSTDPATFLEHFAEHSVCLTSEQAREFARRILVEAETVERVEARKKPVTQPREPLDGPDNTGESSSAP